MNTNLSQQSNTNVSEKNLAWKEQKYTTNYPLNFIYGLFSWHMF